MKNADLGPFGVVSACRLQLGQGLAFASVERVQLESIHTCVSLRVQAV